MDIWNVITSMSDTMQNENIIKELQEIIDIYKSICARILAKKHLSLKDEIEYDTAMATLERCYQELERHNGTTSDQSG